MKLCNEWRKQFTPASCNSELFFETKDSCKTPRPADQPIVRQRPTQQKHIQPCCDRIQTTIPAMKDSMYLTTYGNCDQHCHNVPQRQYVPHNIWQLRSALSQCPSKTVCTSQHMATVISTVTMSLKDSMYLTTYGNCDQHCHNVPQIHFNIILPFIPRSLPSPLKKDGNRHSPRQNYLTLTPTLHYSNTNTTLL
jgi:hypothetical protein